MSSAEVAQFIIDGLKEETPEREYNDEALKEFVDDYSLKCAKFDHKKDF